MLVALRRIVVATAVLSASLCARVASADPPQCEPEGAARALALDVPGVLARLAVARSGADVLVAARVLPNRNERHGTTRVVFGVLGPDGWRRPPLAIWQEPGRIDGAVAVASHNSVPEVLIADGHGVVRVAITAEGPEVRPIDRPDRHAERVPVFAATDDGFVLAWPAAHASFVEWLRAGANRDAHRIELPTRTRVVQIAAGSDGGAALVIRTSANRFWIASVDASGHRHWPGTAPAGCERNRCPTVTLDRAPNGFVASWSQRVAPADDPLRVWSAMPLDLTGRRTGHVQDFLPMLHGVVFATPRNEPMVLQLARPVILRGGERPVALPGVDDRREVPTVAATWFEDGERTGLLVATRAGAMLRYTLVCASGDASADP